MWGWWDASNNSGTIIMFGEVLGLQSPGFGSCDFTSSKGIHLVESIGCGAASVFLLQFGEGQNLCW